jgi:hypothetical protein
MNNPLQQAKLRTGYVPRGERGSTQNIFKMAFFIVCEIAFSPKRSELPPSTSAAYDEALTLVRNFTGDPGFTPVVNPALFALAKSR